MEYDTLKLILQYNSLEIQIHQHIMNYINKNKNKKSL